MTSSWQLEVKMKAKIFLRREVTMKYGSLVAFIRLNRSDMRTRVALHAINPLFAEGRALAIEEFKYALESWRQTLAFARVPIA
jgi:hypothetical protein